MYLALAMGKTGKKIYGQALLNGLIDKDDASRVAAIKALGDLKYIPSIPELIIFTKKNRLVEERLTATIALGNMPDSSVITILNKLLNDEEPNVRWDAAIGLAKHGDSSGKKIIENLLDRNYYSQFKEVNSDEEVKAILVAIHATSIIPSDSFIANLLKLATLDMNMDIRDFAIKTLNKTYNRKI
tara:strand:- start:3737 stop:4291 length:555 start_codon:yes stop_codon:yes gene_type:complete